MNRARINNASWGAGYLAGFEGRSAKEPPGVDGLSYWSGYIEGKAKGRKSIPGKCRFANEALKSVRNH